MFPDLVSGPGDDDARPNNRDRDCRDGSRSVRAGPGPKRHGPSGTVTGADLKRRKIFRNEIPA